MAYIGVSPSNGVRRVHTYTATASQTTFSGAGAEGTSLSYKDSNFVDVYQNGIKLGDADYTSTSGTSIVLAQGASVDDLVVVVVFDVFSVADTVSKADGGTFDGNVTMAGTLGVTGETTLATHLNLGDSDKIKLGDSGDLEIYHNGTHSFISDEGTGNLILRGSNELLLGTTAGQDILKGTTGGDVKLYHNNVEKFATTSSGVVVNNKVQGASGESLTVESQSGGAVIFNTNGANERMRINSSGYVGIGTNSQSEPLQVYNANFDGAVARFLNIRDTSNANGIKVTIGASGGASGTNSTHFHGNTNAVGNWYLYANGTMSYSSDERLKKNIETTRDGYLEDLAKLRVVKYNWNCDKDGDDKELGLIAQEVEKVFPNLVKDDTNPISEDDPTMYKQLKQSVLPMMLLKALQEANTKITALEARITALENA